MYLPEHSTHILQTLNISVFGLLKQNYKKLLLQIEPDLFEDLVLDDLVSYTPAQNKGKGVSQRKNTTGSIQAGLEVLEEEREEEVSEIRISSRGRIIRNTCKMYFLKFVLAPYNL